MAFYLYILECKDGSYYVGHTDDINKRLIEHSEGLSRYTSMRLPVKLIFTEEFQTRDEAFLLERKIKGWNRKKKEALIQSKFDELVELSKSRNQINDL